jgi:hypothetical protein
VIAKWERGKRSPKDEDDLARCEEIMGTRGVLAMVKDEWVPREEKPEWLGKLREIEQEASSYLSFQNMIVTGLLQTPDYARAVLLAGEQPPVDIDRKVADRMERQEVLNENPPQLMALMDESVLLRPMGGPKAMHEQLTHLVEVAERPEVIVQVVKMGVGAYTGINGPFILANVNGSDVAYVEDPVMGRVIESRAEVAKLRRLWFPLASRALDPEQSINLIMEVMRTYEVA